MSYGYGNYMYRGDPGWMGNLFHAVTGVIGGGIKGLFAGGPAGAIIGAARGAGLATAHNLGSTTLGAGDDPAGDAARMQVIKAHHAAALRKQARGGYAQKAIAAKAGTAIAPDIPWGKAYRRMRWTNTKALGRAERRIKMAVKHMTRYIRWVHPTRQGHAAPKFHKAKRR